MNMILQYLTLLLALAVVMPLTTQAFRVDSKLALTKITSASTPCVSSSTLSIIQDMRAGAVDSDDEYDSDVDEVEGESEDEESDEEEEVATKLSASAVKAMKKAETKKKEEIKKKVSKSLSSSSTASPKKKKKSSSITNKIPYVIRAFMNPFTVIIMIKGYFASLFNIDYLNKDASQNLRSALEEKAKQTSSGRKKRGRKMKPGQAKTLSDLPQLNQ